ncbi:MAG TPA: M23 family metallopeptidase [Candidatus Paceibacterota bacterium]|nr:M23 family metallopeptidase [Candidatus Paceibacterota bacterium]
MEEDFFPRIDTTIAEKAFSPSRAIAVSVVALLIPAAVAYAGFFSFIGDIFAKTTPKPTKQLNSQNVALASVAFSTGVGGPIDDAPNVVAQTALMADTGPGGGLPDADTMDADPGHISVYVVRDGDTLASIADMFGVSVNTIVWANGLSRGKALSVGQTLVILPVSGVQHTVQSGDTMASIAKKYKGDLDEIRDFNGLDESTKLAIGDVLIIPDGEIATQAVTTRPAGSAKLRGTTGPALDGFFRSPMVGYRKTQGLHGYNGVDLASYLGAPIYAAAAGDVIVSRAGGYNGGYGTYVVIAHANGTQTLYAHLSTTHVTVGQHVEQGDVIGAMGNTGRSTGPHLHFEVRGARNPF